MTIAPARRPLRQRSIPFEPLFRALFAEADAGIVLLDSKRRVAGINPAGLRLLSVTRDQVRSRPGVDLIRTPIPGDRPVADAYRSARIERDVVVVTNSGGEVPVILRSYRMGSPPWVIFTLRDLTGLRRMQQELQRHERLATLGQLSAGVAHEIRNPLAGIGTSAQVLLHRFEPRDERARFVRVILEEVSRLDRIVTSLLQYARPRTPELKRGDLVSCLVRVRELAADAIERAQIEVEIDVQARLGPVYIDADLVTQVLLNVTLNAVQAMPQGGRLRYEVRKVRRRRPARGLGRRTTDRSRRERDGRSWVEYQQVRVSDTGPGIARGVLAKLFDPFFSTKPKGTGLGLSISQTIMHEHGGSIEVSSLENHGTTVLLNFPLEKRHGERRELSRDTNRTHPSHR